MAKSKYNHAFKYDFTKLKPGEYLLDAFEELRLHPVFVEHGSGEEGDKYLRFAFLYASQRSGLHAHFTDLRLKKLEAMRLAGIDPNEGTAQLVLTTWAVEPVLLLVRQVVRMDNSRKWSRLFHGSEYYNKALELMAEAGEQTGVQDFKHIGLVGDMLDELEKELFMSDEELATAQKDLERKKSSAVARRSENESFTEDPDDDEE